MIRERQVGCLELTEHFIDRIDKHDGDLNAVVVRDFDAARSAARAADAALAGGVVAGPLHGVPITIKESYDVAGLPTTWGNPALASTRAASDAEAVAALRGAGAIVLGKTNVPLNLGDFQSYNAIYGATSNPWDRARTPGGSSGGAAAALAAGLSALELGSDIGGSIRVPAHFCGVYGHKPSWPIVPPQGHALPGMIAGPDLGVCGPLARTADDLALALGVLARPEPLDRRGWRVALPETRQTALRDFRVALWPEDLLCPVSREISDRVASVGEALARQGARVSDSARPAFDAARAHEAYQALVNVEISALLSDEEYARVAAAVAALAPGDTSRRAQLMRSAAMSHRDWLRLNHEREQRRYVWRAFFEQWDVLICPVYATPAFPHDHGPVGRRTLDVDGVARPYHESMFWTGLPIASYLPATAFPTGLSTQGLPIGLQAIGAEGDDCTTLELARLLERELGGFQPPPGY